MVRAVCAALLLSLVLVCTVLPANADPIQLLNFNYLNDLQQVGDFYNGGGGPNIPNYGVSFSSNVYGLRSAYAPVNPGSGNFSPNPTQTAAIFINGVTGVQTTGYMNVANGFSSGLNFYYTAAFNETVTVWSGANGTGTVLATLSLSPNNSSCSNGPAYCNWTSVGLTFNGTAKSVTFSGGADGIGISDITLGQSTTAIPEPSSIYLLGTGLVGLAIRGARRLLAA
ncbi:MAG: PEP-CTERM sorting domain-containing protein [Acidobacteriia bacterium]|nr:PEP-CTERM sorting domain-containing protein [Terriglobia bacterium]